jgi:hypothetical protein
MVYESGLMTIRLGFRWFAIGYILAVSAVPQLAQTTSERNSPNHLTQIEDDVIHRLSAIQSANSTRKRSHFTHSLSARQIACSEPKQENYLYAAVLNSNGEGDLSKLAEIDSRISGRSVGVGAWFVVTAEHLDGAYFVVARPVPTKNPVWYALSMFTDCPFLRCSRLDGTYPVTSLCETDVR